jgi:hypothetical protein
MRLVCLQLITPQGDEIQRLPLPDVEVADPGEAGAARRPEPARELAALDQRITAALQQEGVSSLLDPLDQRIAISRALLQPDADAAILISLPVQTADNPAPPPELPSGALLLDPESYAFADLFDLEHREDNDEEVDDDASFD